ncbi:3-carboxyethylcatechol 2,3-dioxygenase [Streptomyces sp. NPDC002577]
MPLALVCMSHSPLLDLAHPAPEIRQDVESAFDTARSFVADYDPDLVVAFAPDHYNGFFYDLMPPYCLGLAAEGIGDFGTAAGLLDVPEDLARRCAQAVLDAGIDLAVSLRMQVDHGTVQPLQILLGSLTARPVIPCFVNSVAPPFAPISRVRELGQALGGFLAGLDGRVLLVGSGGLSHDPPVPRLDGATPQVREQLIANRAPSPQARAARQQRVIDAAASFAAGSGELRPLNPAWDERFLDHLQAGDFAALDAYTSEEISAQGGNSAHEIRTWIAAYAALAAAGPYTMTSRYYRPIEEYIAGFAVTTAQPADTVGLVRP